MSEDKDKPQRFDAGDSEAVGLRKSDANARTARKKSALSAFLGTPNGREWMWDLMKECYIFQTTFTGNAETYLREGKRNIGLRVLAEVMAIDPAIFATMMKENGNA